MSNALRAVSVCLRPTLKDCLPVLACILPAELHQKQAILFPARRVLEPKHLLYSKITGSEQRLTRRLKSRHSFVLAAEDLMSNLDQLRNYHSQKQAEHSWNTEWGNRNTRFHQFIPNIDALSSGLHLPKSS